MGNISGSSQDLVSAKMTTLSTVSSAPVKLMCLLIQKYVSQLELKR